MSYIPRVLGHVALFGMLTASFGPANAAQLQLNAHAPYLCAVVKGGATAPGTPVIAYSCSGGPEDQWEYLNGQFQGIGTANGTSMCLDVKGQGTAAGSLVDLWPCNGQANQQWILSLFPLFQIMGLQSGMCLDTSGGPPVGGGTQLVINPCSNPTGADKYSQDWIVRGMQLQGDPSAPYLCANVEGAKTANGTPVIMYSCNDAPNELWNFENGQIYGIGTENGESKCLTVAGTIVASGSLVTLSTCNVSQQFWSLNYIAPGYYSINLSAYYLCLDRSGGPSVGGGTQLVINGCSLGASQNWIVR